MRAGDSAVASVSNFGSTSKCAEGGVEVYRLRSRLGLGFRLGYRRRAALEIDSILCYFWIKDVQPGLANLSAGI
jgi:putative component of toxin-antitoxin plasmid stabilization module